MKKVFRAGFNFRSCFNDFEVIRDTFHIDAVTTATSAIVPQIPQDDNTETFDHYASLGLQEGATQEQIQSSYHTLARLYHPDKSNGLADVSTFFAAQTAYEVLTGRRADANDVIVAHKRRKVSVTNDNEVLDTEMCVLQDYKQRLLSELKIVSERIHVVQNTKSDKQKIDAREAAITFTQRFRMSSRYWDKADLQRWFQPQRYEDFANQQEDRAKYDSLYGPHLREYHQDLDPYMQFLSFRPQYRIENNKARGSANVEQIRARSWNKTIQVRVGWIHSIRPTMVMY